MSRSDNSPDHHPARTSNGRIASSQSWIPSLPPHFVSRRRLLDELDQLASNHVIAVRGPAGTGKTCLLADWLRRGAKVDPAWIAAEASLNEGERLWAAIGTAIFGDTSAEDAGPNVLAARIRASQRVLTIVIDEAHRLEPLLVAEVVRFAHQLPRSRVVIISQSLDDTALSVFASVTDVGHVEAADLTFTTEETDTLLDSLSPAGERRLGLCGAELHDFTGGHPLLTRLVISEYVSTDAEQSFDLGAITLALLPARVRRLALAVAIAQPVDEAMIGQILSEPLSLVDLDQFTSIGLGGFDHYGFFTFSDFTAEAIRTHASSFLPAEEIAEIRARAADTHSERSVHLHRAAQLFVESGRYFDMWPHCIGTLLDSRIDFSASRSHTSAITATAGAKGDSTPRFPADRIERLLARTMHALVLGSHDSAPSSDLLTTVDDCLAELDELLPTAETLTSPLLGRHPAITLTLVEMLLLRSVRRNSEAASAARAVLTAVSADDVSTMDDDTAAWACYCSAVMLSTVGDHDGAEAAIDIIATGQRGRPLGIRPRIHLAFVNAMRGGIDRTKRLLGDPDLLYRADAEANTRSLIARAAIAAEAEDHAEAVRILEPVAEVIERVREWPFVLIVLGRSYTVADPVTGSEKLRSLTRRLQRQTASPPMSGVLRAVRADLELAAGNIDAAQRLTEDRRPTDYALRLSAARIGLLRPGGHHIAELEDLVADPDIWPRLRAHGLLLLAVHQLRSGDEDRARDSMIRATTISSGHQFTRVLNLVPQRELSVLAEMASSELPPETGSSTQFDEMLATVTLTRREEVLIKALASKKILREIAADEFVSVNTIKSQCSTLYRKLDVGSRAEAVTEARRRGLL